MSAISTSLGNEKIGNSGIQDLFERVSALEERVTLLDSKAVNGDSSSLWSSLWSIGMFVPKMLLWIPSNIADTVLPPQERRGYAVQRDFREDRGAPASSSASCSCTGSASVGFAGGGEGVSGGAAAIASIEPRESTSTGPTSVRSWSNIAVQTLLVSIEVYLIGCFMLGLPLLEVFSSAVAIKSAVLGLFG